MPRINCPRCKVIQYKMDVCPYCGYDTKNDPRKEELENKPKMVLGGKCTDCTKTNKHPECTHDRCIIFN